MMSAAIGGASALTADLKLLLLPHSMACCQQCRFSCRAAEPPAPERQRLRRDSGSPPLCLRRARPLTRRNNSNYAASLAETDRHRGKRKGNSARNGCNAERSGAWHHQRP